MPAASVRIVADDLTGAADAGAPFAARGYETCIWLHGVTPVEQCEVPVFETSSRHCAPETAYARVRQALENGGDGLVFKKMDSTLHGNLGPELRAVRDALGVEFVVTAPSHPRMGRTMRDGMLYVNGKASGKVLPSLLAAQGLAAAEWLVVCDCEEESDLDQIVDKWWGRRVAFAGAGALAAAVAGRLPEKVALPRPAPVEQVLVIAGSKNAVTLAQVDTLLARRISGVEVMFVEREQLGTDSLRARLAGGTPGGVVIAGGDTARGVAEIVGALGIRLCGEKIPGLPWGTWTGGAWDGKPAATKAGGFGGIEVIVDAVRLLRGELN